MRPSELTDDQMIEYVETIAHGLDIDHEDTGPGKFEGNSNPGLAQALYERSLDQAWADEEDGQGGVRIGRVILHEDDMGFVSMTEYDSPSEARDAWES